MQSVKKKVRRHWFDAQKRIKRKTRFIMDNNRVVGKNISIDVNHVREFYNKRAAFTSENGWGTVLLSAEDPTIALRGHNYDHDVLFPKLNIDEKARVLEIGCGIGRWASIILPHCGCYCGSDFSEEMLKVAEGICGDYYGRYNFHHLSATETVEKDTEFFGGAFDSVLFSGDFYRTKNDQ